MRKPKISKSLVHQPKEVFVGLPGALSPSGLFLLLPAPVLFLILLVPNDRYREFWGTLSYLSPYSWAFVALSLIAVYLGYGKVQQARERTRYLVGVETQRTIILISKILFYTTLAVYLLWFALAALRGFGIGQILGVLSGDKASLLDAKYFYFQKISGLTTWVQLGIPASSFIAMSRLFLPDRTRANIWLLVLTFLGAARAILLAERLAIIEVSLAILVTMAIVSESRTFSKKLNFSALALPLWIGLPVVFGAFEYLRSWAAYYSGVKSSFLEFVTQRLLGYYATALNNAELVGGELDSGTNLSLLFHTNFFGSNGGDLLPALLGSSANPEFNNVSGLTLPFYIFSPFFGFLVMLIFGGYFRALVVRLNSGNFVAVSLYSISTVAILELVRIFYIGDGRFLPVLVVTFLLFPILKRAQAKDESTSENWL